MTRLVSVLVLFALVGCDEPSAPPRSPSHDAPYRGPVDDPPVANTRPPNEDPARALGEMQALLAAASRWSPDNADPCPTGEILRATKGLEQTVATLDPWGRAYKIVCDETSITITSAGPDRKEGTSDDLHVP